MKGIGSPPYYQKPTGRLYLGATQENLVNGVLTLIELDTISANFADAIEDIVNHKITPGKQGYYSIKGQVTFTNVVADKTYVAGISLNGGALLVSGRGHSVIVDDVSVPFCSDVFLSSTDYLEVKAKSNSGDNTVDVIAGENATFLSIQRTR